MPKKVYGIEVPPKFRDDELSFLPTNLWSFVSPQQCGFTSKGDYLSWDEFITRTPKELKNHKQSAWFLLRLRRNLEPIEGLFAIGEKDKPELVFYSPSSLMSKIHQIERLSTLKHLELSDRNRQGFLSTSLIMEEAITSAQLEGAATTRPVAKEMLSTGRAPRDFSEKMIVNNYQLMMYAKSVIDEPLSIELIQNFNRVATQNVCENDHVAGMIRTGPIAVEDVLYHETIHVAPNADFVGVLLSKLCEFTETEHLGNNFIHPIVKAVIIHFMIGYIHPFGDGNGRTARALFYWFMLKSGYDNFQYVSISSLLKSSKSKYAKAFVKSEVDRFDLTHFIDFNFNIIIRALKEFTSFLQHKIDNIQKTRMDLHKSPYFDEFKLPHITILKKALEDAGREFTVKECQAEFNVSSTAARGYLDKLTKLNLLIKHQDKGRKYSYLAPKNLRERLKLT